MYTRAAAPLGGGLTVILGPNGVGKTALLEAIYLGCTGRSFRTLTERELVRFGAEHAQVQLEVAGELGDHVLAVTLAPPAEKRMTVDGNQVDRLIDAQQRPLVSVFAPDRLELIKGVPALRRAHLDQLVAALWPARIATRRSYHQALAQRNACLQRVRAGLAAPSVLDSWDQQLASQAVALTADRSAAVDAIATLVRECCAALGLAGEVRCSYRPRVRSTHSEDLVRELGETRASDVERGFTTLGPHRDDLRIARDGHDLRRFGSQGEQRLALLALLLAERSALAGARARTPVLLLDDVMSELDEQRRAALIELLAGSGQALITATDREHVPAQLEASFLRVAAGGEITVQGQPG